MAAVELSQPSSPLDLQAALRSAAAGAARPAGRQLEATDSAKANRAALDKCTPSLLDVAKEQGQLRQLVALAAAGYDVFAADGGKPFTALAPTDGALQQLAAGAWARGRARVVLRVACCIWHRTTLTAAQASAAKSNQPLATQQAPSPERRGAACPRPGQTPIFCAAVLRCCTACRHRK